MNKVFFVSLALLSSALMMRLSMPPYTLSWLCFIAFVPLLIIVNQTQSHFIAALGFVMSALAWHGELPLALAEWGPILALGSWLSGATLFWCIGFVYLQLSRNRPSIYQCVLFPSIWTLAVFCGQHFLSIPIALSPSFALSHPDLVIEFKMLSFYGMEWMLTFINALIANLISSPQNRKFLIGSSVTGLAIIAAQTTFTFDTDRQQKPLDKMLPIYAIQPAISHKEHTVAGWSMAQRQAHESRLDLLTSSVLHKTPGLILWPEGGNNLPNISIQRRVERIKEMTWNNRHELFIAGEGFDKNNNKYNTITHFAQGAIGTSATKARLAPVAESHLKAGQPTVIRTDLADVGVAICFEALFFNHFLELANDTAELFFVATDDSSLGRSTLEHQHVAYAKLFSIILNRPLAFINNNGPSYLFSNKGKLIGHDHEGTQSSVYEWQLPINKAQYKVETLPHYQFIYVSLLILLITITFSLINQANTLAATKGVTISKKGSLTLIFFFFITLVNFQAFEWRIMARVHQQSFTGYWHTFTSRIRTIPVLDGYSPLFKQESKYSCGAAALAFALTKLGDTVFERDLIHTAPPQSEAGYSFLELKTLAQSRGFKAEGENLTWQELLQKSLPFIAHWKEQHFLVVMNVKPSEVTYFDPAKGQTVYESASEFKSKWSGFVLSLSYNDDWLYMRSEIQKSLANKHRFSRGVLKTAQNIRSN